MPLRNLDRTSDSSGSLRMENLLAQVLERVEFTNFGLKEIKGEISNVSQLVDSHSTSII